jgi:hypothetical protein
MVLNRREHAKGMTLRVKASTCSAMMKGRAFCEIVFLTVMLMIIQ